jgi:hypothetical protein
MRWLYYGDQALSYDEHCRRTGQAAAAASQLPGPGAPRIRSERSLQPSLGSETGYICYAVKPNHWLIRSDGRLGRCTVLLGNPVNDLGFIDRDGTLHIRNELMPAWLSGLEDLDPQRLACPVPHIMKNPPKTRIIEIAAAYSK